MKMSMGFGMVPEQRQEMTQRQTLICGLCGQEHERARPSVTGKAAGITEQRVSLFGALAFAQCPCCLGDTSLRKDCSRWRAKVRAWLKKREA